MKTKPTNEIPTNPAAYYRPEEKATLAGAKGQPLGPDENACLAGVKVRIVSVFSGLYFVQPLGKGHGLKAATVAANSAAGALEIYKKANSKK